jgi:hypothetical protein
MLVSRSYRLKGEYSNGKINALADRISESMYNRQGEKKNVAITTQKGEKPLGIYATTIEKSSKNAQSCNASSARVVPGTLPS